MWGKKVEKFEIRIKKKKVFNFGFKARNVNRKPRGKLQTSEKF